MTLSNRGNLNDDHVTNLSNISRIAILNDVSELRTVFKQQISDCFPLSSEHPAKYM